MFSICHTIHNRSQFSLNKSLITYVKQVPNQEQISESGKDAYWFHHQCDAASTSETSVNFYKTPLCNNPESGVLDTRVRETLKSRREPLFIFTYTLGHRTDRQFWNLFLVSPCLFRIQVKQNSLIPPFFYHLETQELFNMQSKWLTHHH
jgi:hypothetical protein